MRAFTPSAPIAAFFNALESAAASGLKSAPAGLGYSYTYRAYPLPAVPPRPTDPHEAAFYDTICMPLYNQMLAANQADAAAITPTAATSPPSAYDQWLASGTMPSAP